MLPIGASFSFTVFATDFSGRQTFAGDVRATFLGRVFDKPATDVAGMSSSWLWTEYCGVNVLHVAACGNKSCVAPVLTMHRPTRSPPARLRKR